MSHTDEHAEARAEFLKSLGLEYSATFVPQSLSRNAKETAKTLNWRIRLARLNAVEIVTDYSQGIGHVPGYPSNLPRTLYFEPLRKDFEAASETGRYPINALSKHTHENGVRLDVRPGYLKSPLPAPTLEDVLHSLILDASAWRMTFEEWCGDYGYDTDSRKAHAAYMTCSDIGLRLVRMVGGSEAFERLEALYSAF